MRTSDVDILIIPGFNGSGPDHWQSRWEANLSTARRVEQFDWDRPRRDEWVARVVEAAAATTRPAVLVAHSLGVLTVAHAAPQLSGKVIGAFLVAPPDETAVAALPEIDPTVVPVPRAPLPFPATLIASDNDPYCGLAAAEDFCFAWGAAFANAGAAGHINTESGHGPWPEGLLGFATFLKRLGPAAP
jgi:predicted alpha/beta hydrolase family esterase